CGAFTTFSTWMLETSNLMKDGEMWLAFWNLAGSVAAGFFIFRAGVLLGRII
ncbi:MAG: CrcB family protein, partial [Candidatus Omnitrophica bacterium]|nr:CrcB family protein [Candidatus Omnitrophota bacterium]